jgi:hypothetical protein
MNRTVAGVLAAAYARALPMVQFEEAIPLRTTPAPMAGPPARGSPFVYLVSREYLAALRIRVVAGRGFGERDGAGQPRVLLVNETLARRDFAGTPIGRTVYLGRDAIPWSIVGVNADVRQLTLDREPRPQYFADVRQWPEVGAPPSCPRAARRESIPSSRCAANSGAFVGRPFQGGRRSPALQRVSTGCAARRPPSV